MGNKNRSILSHKLAFAVRHPGQIPPYFTQCPIEIIDQCLTDVGRIMVTEGFFDFTFYADDDQDCQVHREEFYYRPETLLALAERHGLNSQLLDDWHDPWAHQPKMRLTRRTGPAP